MTRARCFFRITSSAEDSCEQGQTVMEYALLVALISVGVLVAATGMGVSLVAAAGAKLATLVT